ncbi:MAG TPA: TonB-dependent receptor, partial [Polyangiaceae bacterium]|nr:TonB-dependent receptor [Polyangiaceae bacterium]
MRAGFILALGVLLVARQAAAQTADVTVHGEPAGNFVSTAGERESPRELTDAASLLEPLPGVHVRRFGADDSFSTLSIRGSSSNEVAVVLAGVPLTGGADPTLDLATLPLWPGAVAHVHRSFAPAALGPGSLGGTLVLDPPKPTAPESSDVWAAGGSFGAARLRVGEVRALGGDGRVATALSASRADDVFTYLDPTASTPGHDVFVRRENAGHAAVNGLVSWALPVRWNDASAGALTVTTMIQGRRQQLPGTVLGPTPFARLTTDRELASAELTGALGVGAWSARGWGRREGLEVRDSMASPALGPTLSDQTIVGTGGSVGWRGRPAPDAHVEVRVDGSGERFAPGLVEGAAPPPEATRGSAGAALDADWRAVEAVTLAASGRIDGWSGVASDGTQTGEVRPTGHVGAEAALEAVTLAAHAGTTSRPPSFVELYGDRGAFVGDASLRPESAWTVDGGARASRRLGVVRVAVEIAGFATWAEDLITFVPTGAYGRAKATNIGRARMAGVEVDGHVAAGPFEARASYTGLATEDDASCTAATGGCARPPLPGRPRSDFVGDAMTRVGPVVVRVGVDAVTGMVA